MTTEAILLDALGTMVELEPPWERLARSLGVASDPRLVAAVRVEMAYYREHAHEGRDATSVADLRRRCAIVLSDELGVTVDVATLMDSIRFRPYPDVAPALAELRRRGLRLVCVSNWDASLVEVLERTGLAPALDASVSSAEVGAPKPDPRIFRRALELAGCSPGAALHVGDTPAEDLAGARAAGIRGLLIDRGGGGEIASLAEIADHLRP